jgi:hypothetical protein
VLAEKHQWVADDGDQILILSKGYLYSSNEFTKCGSQVNTSSNGAVDIGLRFEKKRTRVLKEFPVLYRNHRYALISRAI